MMSNSNRHVDQLKTMKITEKNKMDANDHEGQQLASESNNNQQIRGKKRKFDVLTLKLTAIWRLVHWSASRKTLVVNCYLTSLLVLILSLLIPGHQCDEDPMQNGDNQAITQQQTITQQQQQEELINSMLTNNQRSPRQLTWADILGQQQQQQPDSQSGESSRDLELAANMLNQQLNHQHHQQAYAQEQRQAESLSSGDQSDLLESAQSKSISTGGDQNSDKSTSGANGSPASLSSSSASSSSSSSSSPSSSSASPLSEQLSAVSNLIQQAGQLGLTAAQQNNALSEAIINGVTNSLIRNTQNAHHRHRQQQQSSSASQQSTTTNTNNLSRPVTVGQAIEGDISYDPNENAINGFINFPNLNFSGLGGGNKPSISSAVKPILLAAIKTVPIKLGSVGWKLLQLLAWKKIYKAHHPKSGEIIIEQEVKSHGSGSHLVDKGVGGGGGGGGSISSSGKMGTKMGEHFANKFKTSKMGHSYVGGGGSGGMTGSGDDWMSMMRSFGHGGGGGGGDMFSSGGWPQASSESPSAAASMLYQRHLMSPAGGGSAGSQPAAAAAAAAAATAAAMQSHWLHQQHMMAASAAAANDEDTAAESQPQTRSNATTGSGVNSASSAAANVLRRKKASFGGGNWFAATPAHAYAAAAAAANAAVSLASQQHQHQQRMAQMMRTFEFGSGAMDPIQMMAANGAAPPPLSATGHGHGGGSLYHNLFDNAAAMAVQNAVKLPHMDAHNPLAGADFLDQSDSLSGSPFGSFSSATGDSPLSLMQRHDIFDQQQQQQQQSAHSDNHDTMNYHHHHQAGVQRSSASALDAMQDFDDTPAGKILTNALNESSSFPVYQMIQQRRRMDK